MKFLTQRRGDAEVGCWCLESYFCSLIYSAKHHNQIASASPRLCVRKIQFEVPYGC